MRPWAKQSNSVGRVLYTQRAREDLIEIWLRIAAESPTTADECLDRIDARCQQLSTFPKMGPERIDISPDARALVIERWLALYRLVEQGVQIVRVVDGVRDLTHLELPAV